MSDTGIFITYEEYVALGYTLVPEAKFARFETMARVTVTRFTQDRVAADTLTTENKRGVCELIDLFYGYFNPDAVSPGAITGFTNKSYSESYAAGDAPTFDARVDSVIANYFTQAERFRGVG